MARRLRAGEARARGNGTDARGISERSRATDGGAKDMSDKNGIAQINKPVQLTWRNRRVKTKENNDGVFFLVEVEVDEEAWGFLKTIPRNADGEMLIWITDIGMVAEKKPTKPKGPKGPYSYFWEFIHNSGFLTFPNVFEALEAIRLTPQEDSWKDLLHRFFNVKTLAFTSDKDVLAKFPEKENPKVKLLLNGH